MLTGAVSLVVGIVIFWVAEPLSRVYLTRDGNGSSSMIDEDRMERIQFIGDRLSWLGLGLIVVGSAAWVSRRENTA